MDEHFDQGTGKKVNLELINYQIQELKGMFQKLDQKLDEKVVTRTEFELRVGRVEKLLYGAIGLALVGIVKAILDIALR